eukprot:SM000363S13645  [mRNA]  locus=s363:53475:60276:- [translate_table: standard]
MRVDDAEGSPLSRFLLAALLPISEADPALLSKYVSALLRNTKPLPELRQLCVDQLHDFLGDETETFVQRLFTALEDGTIPPLSPARVALGSSPPRADDAPQALPTDAVTDSVRGGVAAVEDSKGRQGSSAASPGKQQDAAGEPERELNAVGVRRASETGERGVPSRPEVRGFGMPPPPLLGLGPGPGPQLQPGFYGAGRGLPSSRPPPLPGPPLPMPVGPPPWAAFARLPPPVPEQARRPARCIDFEERGFCLRGDLCPMDHGTNHIIVEDMQQFNLPGALPVPQHGHEARPGPGRPGRAAIGVGPPGKRLRSNRDSLDGTSTAGHNDSPSTNRREGQAESYDPDQPLWEEGGSKKVRKTEAVGSVWDRIQPPPHSSAFGAAEDGLAAPRNVDGPSSVQVEREDFVEDGLGDTPRVPNDAPTPGGSSRQRGRPREGGRAERTLCVSSIPLDLRGKEGLMAHFRKFGRMVNLRTVQQGERAFVQFARLEDAEAALRAPEAVMGNRFIRTSWAHRDSVPLHETAPPAASPAVPASSSPAPGDIATQPATPSPSAAAPAGAQWEKLEKLKEIQQRKEALLRQQIEHQKQLLERLTAGKKANNGALSPAVSAPVSQNASTGEEPMPASLTGGTLSPAAAQAPRALKSSGFGSGSPSFHRGAAPAWGPQRFKLDNRPTVVQVLPPVPPALANVQALLSHFQGFGEVARIEAGGSESPEGSVFHVRFKTRREAEWALAEGGWAGPEPGDRLRLAWPSPAAKASPDAGVAAAGRVMGKPRPVCRHFAARGWCAYGSRCRFCHAAAVAPPPPLPRRWRHASALPPPGDHDTFVVGSHNILAADTAVHFHARLYGHVRPDVLAWPFRKRLVLHEMLSWAPDVLCLQEVDRFKELEAELAEAGFVGLFKARTGDARDGCATFWRSEKFAMVHEKSLEFRDHNLRDNVAQLLALETQVATLDDAKYWQATVQLQSSNFVARHWCSTTGPVVVVANVHILFNPKRGDIKMGQVRILAEAARGFAQMCTPQAPIIIAGDFNCCPGVDLQGLDRRNLAGQLEMEGPGFHVGLMRSRQGWPGRGWSLPESQSLPQVDMQMRYIWFYEELEAATGSSQSSVACHSLRLQSAYSEIEGADRRRGEEPPITSYHWGFQGTVDYVWHTEELQPLRVLDLPPRDHILRLRGLPSEHYGSDHLGLACEFSLPRITRTTHVEAGVGTDAIDVPEDKHRQRLTRAHIRFPVDDNG